ncbi:heparin-binding hemagglutinin [Williamsia sp. CHRR-6]|uniref:heparin-binding hemagglutinin n=1 Tax=Williamsia sp. CHRR-6 TaxID=2835871 RepID=UPI001BDAC8D5|nr:heparin-binding hemagglutinin [Williamsia sp. CHRR-6]MBT0566945.1 heparin-binding hemagglutinin [Williamsia sp. CHRR-6]
MSKNDRGLASPIYAAVGVTDLALQHAQELLGQLREATETAAETAQARIEETVEKINALPEEVPAGIEELRSKFTSEELRKLAEAYIEVATSIYNSLAERGEEAVGRLIQTPEAQEAVEELDEAYNEAVDVTQETLGTISSQTRAVGKKAAELANYAAGQIAGAAGTLEAKARRSKDSPAKAIAEVKDATDPAKTPAKKAPAAVKKAVAPAKKAPAKKAPAKKAPAKKA